MFDIEIIGGQFGLLSDVFVTDILAVREVYSCLMVGKDSEKGIVGVIEDFCGESLGFTVEVWLVRVLVGSVVFG